MEDQQIIRELEAQFLPLLDASPDGVYLWLDESHKICNERLAALHGMSVAEWCAAETDMIPISFDGKPEAYHFVRQVGG